MRTRRPTAWRHVLLSGALVAGLLPFATVAASAAAFSLASGNGVPGGTDSLVESSLDGEEWQPADIRLPEAGWAVIPGTAWVTRTSARPLSAVFYRVTFELPPDYGQARVSVDLHADGAAVAFLNGIVVGSQVQADLPANFEGAPDTFTTTAGFKAGVNVLYFRVVDFRGAHGLDFRATITVGRNEPPSADAGGPYEVAEGSSVALAGTGTDPDADDLTFSWDLDADGAFETAGEAPAFDASAIDGPASRTVTLRVCDPDDACDTDEATVSIANVAPTATLHVPAVAADGAMVVALVAPADASAADVEAGFTYAFDCGDGSGPSAFGPASSVTCPAGPLGPRAVSASIRDRDGGVTTSEASTLVHATTGAGAFVIGDGSASGAVTFWSAQWARRNELSGGAAPASFKGYAAVAGASCGDAWTIAPGRGARPTHDLPAYMAVVVTAAVRGGGGSAAGTIEQIVVVRIDSDASAAPGRDGTGTIVATIC